MRVHDVVTELELDVLDLTLLERLEQLLFDLVSDGPVLLVIGSAVWAPSRTSRL
jgi:hypothetical protein